MKSKFFLLFIFVSLLPITADDIPPETDRTEITGLIQNLGLHLFEYHTHKYDDFSIVPLSGKLEKISSYEGKVFLLNFWASWCGPCKSEMPSMQNSWIEFKEKGFEILAINLRESKEKVQQFIEANEYEFPVFLDSDGSIGSYYGASAIPTTYIFDRNGYVVAGIVGGIEWDTRDMRKLISLLLDEKQALDEKQTTVETNTKPETP